MRIAYATEDDRIPGLRGGDASHRPMLSELEVIGIIGRILQIITTTESK